MAGGSRDPHPGDKVLRVRSPSSGSHRDPAYHRHPILSPNLVGSTLLRKIIPPSKYLIKNCRPRDELFKTMADNKSFLFFRCQFNFQPLRKIREKKNCSLIDEHPSIVFKARLRGTNSTLTNGVRIETAF